SNSSIVNHEHKIVMKVEEGFLSGTADATHKIMVMNTFFDKVGYEDNQMQQKARAYFDTVSGLPPDLYAFFKKLDAQRTKGEITHEEFMRQLYLRYAKLIEEGVANGYFDAPH